MRQWTRRRPSGDEGYSLTEIVAAMAVMSVVMAVVTTSLVRMFADVKRTEQISFAADQLDVSMGRLDRELRYAIHVSAPALGLDGTRWYIEYAIPGQKLPNGTVSQARCRQLQLDTTRNVLRLATWDLPSLTPTAPATLATGISLDNGARPFTVYQPPSDKVKTPADGVITASGNKYSSVQLRFKATNGTVEQPVDMTFTSQNITSENLDGETTEKRCTGAARP
ncbi:prepilin-type N-terminal cleavage/methylation domain-containing protein [Actinoplanes sp. NPDC023801]|uniref:prepilin-type N-terminal cleavage/methylation domain-containing protein n=1 Tax=Actinoplanes sp. NPDC023801 TaxID=3154595 RepID=UPI0033F97CB6